MDAIRSERRCLALVVLSAMLAYGVACAGVFVYDDHHAVRDNEALRSLANIPAFFVDVSLFSSLDNRMYRPVLLCTYALNHAVAGLSPWIYKATNVLLHAGVAALLFALARRLGATLASAVAGAVLFAVHPLASEAVNTVSGRSELLLVAALLGALHCHLGAIRGRRHAWIGTAACTIVACGSKETGALVPAVLLVLEIVHPATRHRWREVAWRLMPAAAVVLCYLLLRDALLGVATLRTPRLSGGGDVHTGHGRDLQTQLATMAVAMPRVLGQLVVPVGLTLDPVVAFVRDPWRAEVIAGAMLLLALTVLGLWRPHLTPARPLGTAVAWGTALPWVVIPLNVPLSEHRLYGPLAGLALAAATVTLRGRAWPVLVGTAALALASVSAERSFAYRDEEILWQRAHRTHPESYRACYSLGVCAMQDGRLDEARRWMEEALARYPDYVSARANLAEIHLQLGARGDPRVALRMARWLVERFARPSPFHLLLLSRALTAVAVRTGEAHLFDEAVARALECERVATPKGLMYRTAAHARRMQGRLADALALLDESIARGLDHTTVRLDRACVLEALGRLAEAEQELLRAQAAAPFDPLVIDELRRLRHATPTR